MVKVKLYPEAGRSASGCAHAHILSLFSFLVCTFSFLLLCCNGKSSKNKVLPENQTVLLSELSLLILKWNEWVLHEIH